MHQVARLENSAAEFASKLDDGLRHAIFHNEHPTAMQAAKIPALVQERTKQVHDLRIRIDRSRALLEEDELTEKEAALELHALRCASASSVRRLPSELLVEVFSWCQSDDESDGMSALTVSHVSSQWRAVALGAAELWTRLTVTRTYAQNQDHWQQIVAWFARASPLPLDIRILPKVRRPTSPTPEYPLFAASSAPQLSAQVGKLVLHPVCQLDVTGLLYHPGASFPQLTHLEIDNPDWTIVTDVLPTFHCPTLRSVVLGNLYGFLKEKLPAGFPLPWSQLEVLSMDGFTEYDDVGTVFLSCSRLRKADLNGNSVGQISEELNSSGTVFSRIEDLILELCDFPWNIVHLAHYPALTKLRLTSAGAGWSCKDHLDGLVALADHMPALNDLTLGYIDMSEKVLEVVEPGDDNIAAVLAHLPSLRILRLENCRIHPSLFARLRTHGTEPAILPDLETLDLSDTQFLEFTPEETRRAAENLYRAVTSRATPAASCGGGLRRLHVGLPFGYIKSRGDVSFASLTEGLHSLRPEVHVQID